MKYGALLTNINVKYECMKNIDFFKFNNLLPILTEEVQILTVSGKKVSIQFCLKNKNIYTLNSTSISSTCRL